MQFVILNSYNLLSANEKDLLKQTKILTGRAKFTCPKNRYLGNNEAGILIVPRSLSPRVEFLLEATLFGRLAAVEVHFADVADMFLPNLKFQFLNWHSFDFERAVFFGNRAKRIVADHRPAFHPGGSCS